MIVWDKILQVLRVENRINVEKMNVSAKDVTREKYLINL